MTENVPAATGQGQGGAAGQRGSSLPSTEREGRDVAATERADMVEKEESGLSRLHPLTVGFNKLTMMRQFGLLIGLAASIALGLAVVLWSQKETYRPLMNSANSYSANEVIEVLQANRIDFDIDPASGVVLVRQSDLHQARLAIAGAGLSDDQTVGYELLDQDQPLGTSQFMENARYLRSLEGELARTVSSVNQVRTARVHLAIPERSVFVRDRREPGASVFVDLFAGAEMDPDSVKAIRNLVASSIPELSPENVSIVDQRGRLLSDQTENPEEELTNRQFEYTQRVEQNLVNRINSILSPVVGTDNFRAEVSADVDFTKVEQAEELYNPDLIALRSEQTINEERVGEAEGGVPGALTNQPPGAAEAPEEAAAEGGQQNQPPTTSRSEATRNYEVDRTLSYTQFQQGRLRRLTVAVVVDNLSQTNPETGEVETEEWSEEDLQRMRLLVQDAVGYDPSRGDSINVVNSTFRADDAPMEEPAWYTQPWFWNIAKQILAGLFVLVLVFGVLRPALRNLLSRGAEEQESEEDALASLDVDEDAITDDKVTLSTVEEYQLPGPSESFERQLDALRGLIAEDPGRVALVLKRWVMSND
ncbi:flagellar basal-body MS-ring/collar protein FliF [Saccharospirillum salsuginis]|uniref:Flagellar M-ring protein n=1 Tax=Saccharospirillum salsuginis TaxID=418750 RepID=A0A918K5A0_9GAMM|nr:flagellar basal-body MS-ring/collar protein FliF [Saccharospirillum salsuginis]GGX50687.1 flagellar M-ring protein [Saccharospirillum salsuginis]